MSEMESSEGHRGSAAWAPYDYTDGKKRGVWKTEYPPEARKCIRWETAFLLVLCAVCVLGILYIVHESCQIEGVNRVSSNATQNVDHGTLMFLGIVGALLAGTAGGCCFGIKCMYHFVAKLRWHEDRRLWRLLSPPLSGVLSLFMVFLVAGGLLQIFDREFLEHPIRVMAFSFLVGYFSDKALAKMADVADTLFAGQKQLGRGSTGDQSP